MNPLKRDLVVFILVGLVHDTAGRREQLLTHSVERVRGSSGERRIKADEGELKENQRRPVRVKQKTATDHGHV